MHILLNCECGNTLTVADDHLGREVYCSACGATIAVPDEETGEDPKPKKKSKKTKKPKKAKKTKKAKKAKKTKKSSKAKKAEEDTTPGTETGKEDDIKPDKKDDTVEDHKEEPADDDGKDVSDSGLFADAIAAFAELEGGTGVPAPDDSGDPDAADDEEKAPEPESEADAKSDPEPEPQAEEAAPENAASEDAAPEEPPAPETETEPEAEAEKDPGDSKEEPETESPATLRVRVRPPDGPAEEPDAAEEKEGSDDASPSTGTEAGVDRSKEDPCAPTRVEIFEHKIKFTCVCGKRISAPIQGGKSTGKCPRCSRRVAIPAIKFDPAVATSTESPPEAADAQRCRACGKKQPAAGIKYCSYCGARIDAPPPPSDPSKPKPAEPKGDTARRAAGEAADRLRAGIAKPVSGEADTPVPPTVASSADAASFIGRAMALFIDLAVVMTVFTIMPAALKDTMSLGASLGLGFLMAAICWIVNEVVFASKNGQTFGKALVRISVRRSGGGLPDIKMLLIRALVKGLFLPGGLMAAFDEDSRAAHDMAAGTVVVKGWQPPGKKAAQ